MECIQNTGIVCSTPNPRWSSPAKRPLANCDRPRLAHSSYSQLRRMPKKVEMHEFERNSKCGRCVQRRVFMFVVHFISCLVQSTDVLVLLVPRFRLKSSSDGINNLTNFKLFNVFLDADESKKRKNAKKSNNSEKWAEYKPLQKIRFARA